jgi:hypothetical protein
MGCDEPVGKNSFLISLKLFALLDARKKNENVAFYVNRFILFKTSLAALIPEMITMGIPPPGKVQWPA